MAVVRCSRCDKLVDLDWHVEEIIYIDNESVCVECASEAEIIDWEKNY